MRPHIAKLDLFATRFIQSRTLGKICITAMSAQALFRGHEEKRLPFLDHSSIAVLSRAIIESSIVYWYLMEEVSNEEWDFRLQVMKVHDAASRVRLFKTLIADEAQNQRATLKALRDKLTTMPLFRQRPKEQQVKLRAGEMIYVNGMRSVVGSMNFDECQRRREIASAGRSKIASRRDWRFVDWAMRHGRRVCSVARAVKPCNRVAARFWRGA